MQNMSTEYVGKKEKIQNEMTIELNCLLHRVAVSCDLGAALRMESQRIFRSMGRILCQFSLLARIHFNMVCFLLFFLSFSFSLSCFIAIFLCPLPPRALSLFLLVAVLLFQQLSPAHLFRFSTHSLHRMCIQIYLTQLMTTANRLSWQFKSLSVNWKSINWNGRCRYQYVFFFSSVHVVRLLHCKEAGCVVYGFVVNLDQFPILIITTFCPILLFFMYCRQPRQKGCS